MPFSPARIKVVLATSGGTLAGQPVTHPRFFDGLLIHPEQTAVALLACARVARTRYYKPPGMLAAILRAADPVVTSESHMLRFESFSACRGVYARLDVLADGLDRPPAAVGTTNVDFNPPMREALAKVSGNQPVRLHVGADEIGTKSFGGPIVEHKVPLPESWIKGFAEVQVAASRLHLLADLAIGDARAFLRSLPRSSRHVAWAQPAGQSLRLSSQPAPGAACLAGPERLWSLEPLLRFGSRVRVYGVDDARSNTPTPSAWQLDLLDARYTLVLSPEVNRGFSGEGGLLLDLVSPEAEADADEVATHLGWGEVVGVDVLARAHGLSHARTQTALMFLAAQGRVGFDLAESAYFHRELPLIPEALLKMNPRLLEAQRLLEQGQVHLEGSGARVRSGDQEHRVTFADDADRCTCAWWGRYAGARAVQARAGGSPGGQAMTLPLEDTLIDLARADDLAALRVELRGRSETDRRRLAARAAALLHELRTDPAYPALRTAQVLVLATATPAEVRKIGPWALPADDELAAEVLLELTRSRLADFVETLASLAPTRRRPRFRLMRMLIRAGQLHPPADPGYILAMLGAVRPGPPLAPAPPGRQPGRPRPRLRGLSRRLVRPLPRGPPTHARGTPRAAQALPGAAGEPDSGDSVVGHPSPGTGRRAARGNLRAAATGVAQRCGEHRQSRVETAAGFGGTPRRRGSRPGSA